MRLPPERAAAAASVLGRAFAKDPGFRWALPDDEKRATQLSWLAERLLRIATLLNGHVDALDEQPSAVALWVPVEKPWEEPLRMLFRAGLFAAPFTLGLTAVRRLTVMAAPMTLMHRAFAPIPHDYLMQLAVEPREQGRGLGSALLKEGLERSERAGRAVWLETTNQRNVAFYERHGFVVKGRRSLPNDVTLVGMLREP
ncbi:MAG: GNAT family N-acetyltransferase [Myxococcales bacterium]|nr:GNAT family N-acetyltransferase [Myxococcales bacterium]